MKFLKVFFGTVVLYVLMFAGGSQFSACKKTIVEHDTATVIKHDTTTVIKHDTTTIIDSIYDLKDGLIAYYNFNNGTLNDSSGYGNNIVFNNATLTTDRLGRANNAYLFNGSSSYMRVNTSASLNPSAITMLAIVKLSGFYQGLNHANQIFMKGSSNAANGVYGLWVLPSTGDCCTPGAADTSQEVAAGFCGNNSSIAVSDNTDFIRTAKWITVAVTCDGIQAKIYLDGVLKGTQNGAPAFTPNASDLFIGKTENSTYPYLFNGVIDEIRIYNRALPLAEIKQLNKLTQ